MNKEKGHTLSDEDLLKEHKKNKSYRIYDAVIFGFLIGIAIYSSVKNGLGLLSFLPLVYVPVAAKNKKRYDLIEKLVKERGL